MRILMIIHTPWSRELGAPRVQLELGEEFRRAGHQVDKFSYEDAFPQRQSVYARLTNDFSRQAKRFVQAHGKDYEIIDAHQTDLPWHKRELGFAGLLVARSVGLIPFYETILKEVDAKRPPRPPSVRRRIGDIKRTLEWVVTWRARRRRTGDVVPSLCAADLINVCNQDELAYVRDRLGFGTKSVCLPFGLSTERAGGFAASVRPACERLAHKQVAFIGSWSARKGAWDWGAIIRQVRPAVPGAKFLFLGTGSTESIVRRDIALGDDPAIEVRPGYRSEELPALLGSATAGAFPSYIEGFPFAVLETLAAGLPTVAYDAPGARETLRGQCSGWLVPSGDTAAFSQRLIEILMASEDQYAAAARRASEAAEQFRWEPIAARTLAVYKDARARLN